MSTEVRALGAEEGKGLAEALPEIPFTAVSQNALRIGHARGFVVGSVSDFRAAVVQVPAVVGEPEVFGDDMEALWAILSRLPGWFAINVQHVGVRRVKAMLESQLRRTTQSFGDVYFTVEGEPFWFDHPWVRLLHAEDAPLVEAAVPALWPRAAPPPSEWLPMGVAAGAIADGRLVGLVGAPNLMGRYANVGADTLEGFRGQGIARAAASRVAREVLRRGPVPVWSTREDNLPSLTVARRVGFREFSREAYVVVPEWRTTGGFDPAVVTRL